MKTYSFVVVVAAAGIAVTVVAYMTNSGCFFTVEIVVVAVAVGAAVTSFFSTLFVHMVER